MENETRPADFPRFCGEPSVCEGENRVRLSRQLQRVYDYMRGGVPATLREIADACGCSESSASARLRDFRKVEIMGDGTCDVTRAFVRAGVYAYSVTRRGQ